MESKFSSPLDNSSSSLGTYIATDDEDEEEEDRNIISLFKIQFFFEFSEILMNKACRLPILADFDLLIKLFTNYLKQYKML